MRCKSQSSIEFLSVYGFAFLIIALVIAVVFSLSGIPRSIIPSQCTFYGGLTCIDAIYAPTGASHSTLLLDIYDGQAGILNISTFNATLNSRNSVNGFCVPHEIMQGQTTYCVANFSSSPVLSVGYTGTIQIASNYCPAPPGSFNSGSCILAGKSQYSITGSVNMHSANVSSTTSIDRAYYMPINVINTQTGAEPVPFQQMISFNPSSYSAYESQNLGNIRFYLNGTELYSWCESGCTSTSSNAIFWVSVPVVMPAGSTTPLTMYFLPTIVQYDGIYAGEAPQFSNTYGQYDNGGSVFNLYTGFEGTFVSSPWIIRTNYNENSLVNNGFSVSAAIANQPNPGENDTYGSGFGYMYVSSLGSTSGGPEFCWDSAGSCVTSAPLTKVGIYSLAYPGGGATGSAYFLLDSGSGGGSWGVDWAFIATYPYNGVMPSFSLGPVYPVNSMA